MPSIIYDPILIFAWYAVVPDKPPLEEVLTVLCNRDHLAMQAVHAALIRNGTCTASDCCDYCIDGDRDPFAAEYELVKAENGLIRDIENDNTEKSVRSVLLRKVVVK